MIFWRILDNILYSVNDTKRLGFSIDNPSYIPDEYLEGGEFTVMRSCHGVGDWGIISAMPRLLKEKYPNCKVYVPSPKLLKSLFGEYEDNWGSWNDPFLNVETIFQNNPHIDGFKDYVLGDVFHDHYRIYDTENLGTPLVEQMLKFWQFEPSEYDDTMPELYWSDEEIKLGDSIINDNVGTKEFGSLLISNRYDYTQDNIIIDLLKRNPMPYFYYIGKPIGQTDFDFIEKALDFNHIDARIQLYIKSKSQINISNQSGMGDLTSRYSDTFSIQRQVPHRHNVVSGINYVVDENKKKLLDDLPDKYVSKTTTSLKWKADFIDYFDTGEYKKCNAVEIGSSLGATTHVLSHLFEKVIAVDNLSDRHVKSEQVYNSDRDNITYVTKDVYNSEWQFGKVDLFIIDCIHDYEHIKLDIDNAIKTFDNVMNGESKRLLAFDDYGLFPELKQAIDEYIESGQLELIKYIGHPAGNSFPKTLHKVLKDKEGIICYVKKRIN
jgi:hypothetical protein